MGPRTRNRGRVSRQNSSNKDSQLPPKDDLSQNDSFKDGKKEAPQSKWRWITWELQNIKNLPHFLQDNEFLHNYHRPELPSIRQCFRSAFSLHTETCNIWTHALGCIGTLVAAVYFMCLPTTSFTQKLWFTVYFFGATICMGFSAVFHTMLCYSEKAHKTLAKMDYCGIVVLIVSSFPAWMHYCFYCEQIIKFTYMIAVSILGAFCIAVVVHEKFASKEYRPYRAALFVALGLFGAVPTGHFLIMHGFHAAKEYVYWLLLMAFLYIFGAVIYALRIPERIIPGKFDIWGHSHQFLHICVVGGVISCYCGMKKIASKMMDMDCDNFTSFE